MRRGRAGLHPLRRGPPRRHPVRQAQVLGVLLLAMLAALRVLDPAAMEILRHRGFDLTMSLRPEPTHTPAVAVVDIDNASAARFGGWPWPREVLARLIDRLAEAGASVVVVDLPLSEPDPRSPAHLADTLASLDPRAREALRRLGDHDEALARAMWRAPVVTMVVVPDEPREEGVPPTASRVVVHGEPALDRLPTAEAVARSLPALEAASRGVGVAKLYPGKDGVTRTVPAAVAVDGVLLPGLAVETMRIATDSPGLVLEVPSLLGPEGMLVGPLFVPTDVAGRLWIDGRHSERIPVVPAHRVLQEGAPAAVGGRIALVGMSVSGASGTVLTAEGQRIPEALFQAMAIDAIAASQTLARPPGLFLIEMLAAAAVGLLLIVASPWLSLTRLGVLTIGLGISVAAIAGSITVWAGLLVDATLPLLACFSIAGNAAVGLMRESGAERSHREAQLKRQDAYMRKIVDASFDAIVTVDLGGRILTANAGAERLFALSRDDLLQSRIDELLDGVWAEGLRSWPDRALQEAVDTRSIIAAPVRDRATGRTVDTELTVAETIAGAQPVYVIVLRDISARRRAEEAARQADERLRDAIEAIADGFALFGPDRRLVMCNGHYRAMLGEAGIAAVVGTPFDLIMERYAQAASAPVEAVGRVDAWVGERSAAFVRADPPREQECLDGRWFRIDERRTSDGGLVGIYSDITELKRREHELTDAMLRAEAASSAKSEFLANMSHELRTPLNAVIGFADLMKREIFGPVGDERYRTYVSDIIESGSKLLGLIEVILDFSRSEHATILDGNARSDLNFVIQAVLRDIGPAAIKRRVQINADLEERMPLLNVDEVVLYQILQNLVSNAIKFSPVDAMVSVRSFTSPDGRQAVTVTDLGPGIPPDMVEKVTQPFWQRHGPLVRGHGGVGLGLAIVKTHIDTLEGELRFESPPERGTAVTVLFPKARIADAA